MNIDEKLEPNARGTWWQRFLIWAFSIALTLLLYWLLGFVLQDIGRLRGPDWTEFDALHHNPQLRTTSERQEKEIAETKRQIENEERRQRLLRDSTSSSQKTLSQLLELQRISIEQKTTLPEDQQQALVESQRLFLENQTKDQEISESLATLQEQLADLTDSQREINQQIGAAQASLQTKFQRLERQHRLKVAAIKIGVLTPLMLLGGYLFARFRQSHFAPIVYAFDLAVLATAFRVMHQYFPSEYFRYILIGASIAVIGWLLARLLLLVAQPSRSTRLKQYREAYESYFCPVCHYPIRRGPLRFMSWTPRSLRRASKPIADVSDEPYTCPSCATLLYEKCPNCGATRHAMLPACDHCGAVKEV